MCGHIIRLDIGRHVTPEMEREIVKLHVLRPESAKDKRPRTPREVADEYRRYLRGELPDPRD